jgi:O-antigen/teichoic acid export membrane protein
MSNDRSVAIKGTFWTSVSTAVTLVATFARTMILTRFLEKSDFGVVSIINMVIGLCVTFTDLGFASVIMYRQKLTDKEFSTLYWVQLILFVGIYIILWLCSPLVASFYNEPVLSGLIPVASLSVICQAIGKLYGSVLQKRYQFKLLAFRNIISNLISLVIAWWLAWKGYGVYSLVISTLSHAVILNLWNFISGSKIQKVSFLFDFREVVSLIKIGVYQTGARILDFFSAKMDVMIIGKLLGTESLGVYDLAKELAFKFVDFIRSVVLNVALPILSNSNTDDNSVKSKFLVITKTVATLCLPVCLAIAVFSKDIVHIVYGEKYLEIAPMVTVFAIITVITNFTCFFSMLGISKGRTDLNLRTTVYRVFLTIPTVFICSHISIFGVVIGQLFLTIIISIVIWHVVLVKTYPIPVKLYFSQFDKQLILNVVVSLIVFAIHQLGFVSIITANWGIKFVIEAIIYVLFWAIGMRLFLMKDVQFFIDFLKR